MLSVGSLCTGYGGLEMGLQAVFGDIDLRFVSDIDKDVNKLLQHHHPTVTNLGDLTVVKWADIEPVDVLCAGYPCQPFSHAGERKGLEDERAIFEYIGDAISVLRPRNVFLENVAGHLTLGGTAVIGTLTRLGYNAKWGIVRASDTGAPHQRKRLFIWAETADTYSKRLQRHDEKRTASVSGDVPRRQVETTESYKPFVADAASVGLQEFWSGVGLGEKIGEACKSGFFGSYEPAIRRWELITNSACPTPTDDKGVEPAFVEWIMGLSQDYVTGIGLSRTAQLRILGNGVVPQQAALALHLLAERGYYAKTA
tara:strand:- start:1813 stop:2748 length:936 start_codon:yes stop_codon:yes gene_type:complete